MHKNSSEHVEDEKFNFEVMSFSVWKDEQPARKECEKMWNAYLPKMNVPFSMANIECCAAIL